MPRYYFHYRTDDDLIRDPSGSEHSDLFEAEHNAAEIGRAIMEKLSGEGADTNGARSIEITDASGHELLYVVFWVGPKVSAGPPMPVEPATLH